VLRGIFAPKKGEMTEAEEDCIMRGFVIFTIHKILLD
jgi:hypothetical protein